MHPFATFVIQAPAPVLPRPVRPDARLQALFQGRARTFAFAARCLPAERRAAVVGLYAFARHVDDLVDDPPPGASLGQVWQQLQAWRAWLDCPELADAPDPSVGTAVRPVLLDHGVPARTLQLLVDGVASDLGGRTIASWPELRTYCVQVAASVGLAMCHLLGVGEDPLARQAAVDLGIAMQLTNVLRDVGEDLRAGRVYLPADELAAHSYSRERLRTLAAALATHGLSAMDPDFRALMRTQVARARTHYARGLAGVARLPLDSRLAILLSGRLYAAILDEIEAADFDVFTRRAATSPGRKSAELARCWLGVQLLRGGQHLTRLGLDLGPAEAFR